MVKLHRRLLNPPDNLIVDHKNGNPLDCRRANLRLATKAENSWNSRRPRNNTSGFKGAYFCKDTGKYQARIAVSRKVIRLGTFDTAEQAHHAYLEAANLHFGEFARAA